MLGKYAVDFASDTNATGSISVMINSQAFW